MDAQVSSHAVKSSANPLPGQGRDAELAVRQMRAHFTMAPNRSSSLRQRGPTSDDLDVNRGRSREKLENQARRPFGAANAVWTPFANCSRWPWV